MHVLWCGIETRMAPSAFVCSHLLVYAPKYGYTLYYVIDGSVWTGVHRYAHVYAYMYLYCYIYVYIMYIHLCLDARMCVRMDAFFVHMYRYVGVLIPISRVSIAIHSSESMSMGMDIHPFFDTYTSERHRVRARVRPNGLHLP